MTKTILYTAAHSGFRLDQVPLGGGAAICQRLSAAWGQKPPFPLEILGPSLMNGALPRKDLTDFSELEYARFCRSFEKVVTEKILTYDPQKVVILSNDISEGPDFSLLARKGYPIFTIYHVDVVDYFTTFYLKSLVRPQTTTAFYRMLQRGGLANLLPGVLKLVWEKQDASVRHSRGMIVPSQHMKTVLLACYPDLPADRIHVLPWGIWEDPVEGPAVQEATQVLKAQYPQTDATFKLLLLSRISPEKGQHQLLEALRLWEKERDFPAEGVTVYLSGEAAYMMGKKYEKRLRQLAASLKRSKVLFVGYAAGPKKKALFKMADLYVFPSIHESYGLTMMEALRNGLPVLTTPSYGAREIFREGMGEMVAEGPKRNVPDLLMKGLRRLQGRGDQLKGMGAHNAVWAAQRDFSVTASTLAALLANQ